MGEGHMDEQMMPGCTLDLSVLMGGGGGGGGGGLVPW